MTTGSEGAAGPEPIRLRTASDLKRARIDRVLVGLLPQLSRTHIKELIDGGHVQLNGASIRRAGDLIEGECEFVVTLAPRRNLRVESGDPNALTVLHEDEALIVIDKPPGMLAHPTESARGNSVAELAALRFGALPTLQGDDRPGVVHRLDAGTSGVMVLARTRDAFVALMQQFRARSVEKTYNALAYGEPRFDTGWIDAPITRDPRDSGRMALATPGEGREARTFYRVLERFAGLALLEAQPKTGRTHQIRVHLTSIGMPLVGDKLYRRKGGHSIQLPSAAPIPARQCLHASAITLEHPTSGERVTYQAPLAADFAAMLEWVRSNAR